MKKRQMRRRLRRLETNTRKILMMLDALCDRFEDDPHAFIGTLQEFSEWGGVDGCSCDTCARARNMGIAPVH